MEVKIIVSDGQAAAAAAPAVMVSGAPAAQPSMAPQAGGAQDYQQGAATPPAEILRAAAATGAINAGPAPGIFSQGLGNQGLGGQDVAGAPPAFITGNAASPSASGAPQSGMGGPDIPAGAAPGSGAQMETYTAPEPGGGE